MLPSIMSHQTCPISNAFSCIWNLTRVSEVFSLKVLCFTAEEEEKLMKKKTGLNPEDTFGVTKTEQ